MIQRQQTLWLLLATIAAVLSFLFPFAVGSEKPSAVLVPIELDASSKMPLMILSGASLAISTITIFLFKSRKQQMTLCIVGLLISIALAGFYISQTMQLIKPTIAVWCVLPLLMVIGYFMAWKNIRKDEKLIKSLDKLR